MENNTNDKSFHPSDASDMMVEEGDLTIQESMSIEEKMRPLKTPLKNQGSCQTWRKGMLIKSEGTCIGLRILG